MDSTYVTNHVCLPDTLNAHVSNIPSSIKIDGIVEVTDTSYNSHLSDLLSLGNTIVEYGIGFSDIVSTIVFPLIIAIFAFAFPFLFDAINKINSRYKSEVLSELYSSSYSYIRFRIAIILSIGWLLLYGFLSLFQFDVWHHWIGLICTPISMIVVSFLVYSVIRFVKESVSFNKPSEIIGKIEVRYKLEKNKAKKEDEKFEKRLNKKKEKAESKRVKNQWDYIGRINNNASSNNADTNYVNRLSNLCRYAFVENDYNLFYSIIKKIEELINDEMSLSSENGENTLPEAQFKYKSANFLAKAYEDYFLSARDRGVQIQLIETWLKGFSPNKYPNRSDVYMLIKALLKVASRGELRFIESYFDLCKHSFNYVLNLPLLLYVEKGKIDKRPIVIKKSQEIWDYICDYHFILAAFAYHQGLNTLPRQILVDEYGIGVLPHNKQMLLIRYARCKAIFKEDGSFDYSKSDDLFGQKVNPEFVDIFAATLFALLDDSKGLSYYPTVTEDVKNVLKNNKEHFIKIGNKQKEDYIVKKLYHKICGFNYGSHYVDVFKSLMKVPSSKDYEDVLTEHISEDINTYFWNQISQIDFYTNKHMWGHNNADKTEVLSLNPCMFSYDKSFLKNLSVDKYFFAFRPAMGVIVSRFVYLYLNAIKQMNTKDVYLSPDRFEAFVKAATEGQYDKYTLLDFESNTDLILHIAHRGFNDCYFDDIPFIHVNHYGYIQDTDLYKKYKGSIVLINNDDLPYIDCDVSKIDDIVRLLNSNDTNNGSVRVDVTINPARIIKFSKKVSVIRIYVGRVVI